MIIEHRTYTIQAGRVPEYLATYEQYGMPVQRPILGNMIGFFHSEIGALNRIVHMWGYESLDDRQRRRAELAAHPDWPKYLERNNPLALTQENQILIPASFSPIK